LGEASLDAFIARADQASIAPLPGKANEQHYEVPAEFFAQVLGKRRKYSCCYWEHGTTSLEEAEEAALRITCERAELADGMRVLELGCGWGSLSLFIAERFPNCQITAVSNSQSQREFILAQATARGLDRKLKVITADMNSFEPDACFDCVMSIEMFEHMRNHRELLRRISNWLAAEGRLFVHIFCHRQRAYEFSDNGPADWMSRYFFTGGIMPSADLLTRYNEHLRVDRQWSWNGEHYGKTAAAWLEQLDSHRDILIPILQRAYGTPRDAALWIQRWRMFFMAVAELFNYHQGHQWFVSHYLMRPATRVEATSAICEAELIK
jgi:cyclopropane-fatty-acyl-phospholipid synthase